MSRVRAEVLSPSAVRLTCVIRRPRDTVFDAWLNPAEVAVWFLPAPNIQCKVLEMDARPGGKYSLSMEGGDCSGISGTYEVVDRPNKIVFTWFSESSNFEKAVTLVTLNFIAVEEGTRLVLTHEKLSNETSRDNHARGWTGCLTSLERHLAPTQ